MESLTKLQEEVLIGHLLGDGSLIKVNKHNPNHNPRFSIDRSIKDEKYLNYTYNLFKNFCSRNLHFYTNKGYPLIQFSTRCLPVFLPYYTSWYPIGKKIIPKNLKLTPLIISIWLCDDGCITLRGKNKDSLYIRICSESFTHEENIFLAEKIQDFCGEKIICQKINKSNDKHRLILHDKSSRALLNKIDKYFPKEMERKIKWRHLNLLETKREQNLINRTGLTKKELIVIDLVKNNNNITAKMLGNLLNNKLEEIGMKKLSDEYAIKYIVHTYKKRLICRKKEKNKREFIYYIK